MFSTSFPGSSPSRPISRSGGRVGKDPELPRTQTSLFDRRAKEGGKETTGFACCLYPSHGPLRFITSHSRFTLASAMRKTKRLRRRLDPEREVGVNTLCDKLTTDQYQMCVQVGRLVEATRRSDKSLRLYWRIFCENFCLCDRILSLQQVAKKKVRLLAATKFCCIDKDFHKSSPRTYEAICRCKIRRDMLLQLLSPSVYRPLRFYRNISYLV